MQSCTVNILNRDFKGINKITFQSPKISPSVKKGGTIVNLKDDDFPLRITDISGGGTLDDEFEDELKNLLEEAPTAPSAAALPPLPTKHKMVDNSLLKFPIQLLSPIDTIEDIKWKIYKLTGIPIFAQCLYYKQVLPYVITNDDVPVPIIPEKLKNTTIKVDNIPLFDSLQGVIQIKSLDRFMFITKFMNVNGVPYFNLLDMRNFIPPTPIPEFIEEKIFTSLVQYLWPITNRKLFHAYLTNTVNESFPSILKLPKLNEENFVKMMYQDNLSSKLKKMDITTSISELIVRTRTTPIDLRILFDQLRITRNMIYIKAGLIIKNKRFTLIKSAKYKQLSQYSKEVYLDDNTILIVLKNSNFSARLYIRPTYYLASLNVPLTKSVSFAESKELVKRVFNPILADISKLTPVPLINYKVSQIKSIHSVILIRKIINGAEYRRLLDNFTLLRKAGIVEDDHNPGTYFIVRGVQQNPTTFYKLYDNSYRYLYDATAKSQFDQYYTRKRTLRVFHRSSDIQIRMTGLNEDEFNRFLGYVSKLIAASDIKGSDVPSINNDIKKYKREDPVLYDAPGHIYSKICQNANRPNFITSDEFKNVSKKEKKKMIKYWNFTKKEPAYYSCNRGNLHFLANSHPDGYCIPCCAKQKIVKGTERYRIHHDCLTKHTAKPPEKRQRRYVMNYGKPVPYQRVSRLPPVFSALMYEQSSTCRSESYYLFGVPQMYKQYKFGMLYTLAAIINMPIAYTLDKITKSISCTFNRLLQGKIHKYFASYEDLIRALITGEAERDILNLVVLDLLEYFKIYPLLFIDDERHFGSKTSSGNLVFSTKINSINELHARDEFCVIIKKYDEYYPIFYLDPDTYITVGDVLKSIFTNNDNLIQSIAELVKEGKHTFTLNVLETFCKRQKIEIKEVFLNMHNKVYCAIIGTSRESAYIPMSTDYSIKALASYTPFHRNLFTIRPNYQMKILNLLNKFLFNLNLDQLEYNEVLQYKSQFIAIRTSAGDIPIEYTKSKPVGLSVHEITYDPVEVNLAIFNNEKPGHEKMEGLVQTDQYDFHLYDMLKLHYIKFWRKRRNLPLRKKILSAIKNRKTDELTFDSKSDDLSIKQLAEEYFITADFNQITKTFENTQYDFDKVSFSDDTKVIEKYLHKISPKIVIITKSPKNKLDNIITTDTKLQITKNSLDKLLHFYAADIANPLTKSTVTRELYIDRVINELKFTKHPNETISLV